MSRSDAAAVSLEGPLVPARFVERPNRFVVRALPQRSGRDASREGGVEDCHLPDPGRLRELLVPGARLWLRPARRGSGRRTRWTVVLVEPEAGNLVSLDTTLPNRLVGRALEARALDELAGWRLGRSEVTVGRSRFDFLLEREDEPDRRLLLEVKSVTLVRARTALFPDAVTARGRRHVDELAEIVASGEARAAVLFVLQRDDADRIRAAREIDPDFAAALERAAAEGVRLLGRRCRVGRERVRLDSALPVDIRAVTARRSTLE